MDDIAGAAVTIMVVDDDPMTRTLVAGSLGQFGFEVVQAADGAEALQLFPTAGPKLVLLDIKMPGMDGIETLKKLRKLPNGKKIPVIMLTGLADSDSVAKASAAGATDYVTKPINWRLLGQRIQHQLNISSGTV
jgi:CheY-like chemotaxis protein